MESAWNWTDGFRTAKEKDRDAKHEPDTYPTVDVAIPEDDLSFNNTLSHGLCTAFESGAYSEVGDAAKSTWAGIFASRIRDQINRDLPGANLSIQETIFLMDLCPFTTVASPNGEISDFCELFSEQQWHQYNYYETLDKWYGYAHGNPLGPAQGIGFVNELIARMTNKPVKAVGSINATLDADHKSFPLGRQLYADFSHDNDMTTIFAALGLYNETTKLPTTTILEAKDASGFSAAWTVPFAARAYFEKLQCEGLKEESVRVILNDRVVPMKQCGSDSLGRCMLSKFIESLHFARTGGNWEQCFVR